MHVITGASASCEAGVEETLLVAEPGVPASLIETALAARGHAVTRVSPRDPDLFSHAVGRRALVFLPASNLLSAHLAGASGGDAVDTVLRASRAPGVELLLAALPTAEGFDATVEAIERHGKPYVIVRAPGLMQEVAETLQNGKGTLWLPQSGQIRVADASALVDAIVGALATEEQGRALTLPSQSFDVARLFAAASDLAGSPVRVRPVPPFIFNMVRPLARWLGGGEPPLLALADQLLARAAPTGHARAILS